MLKTNEPRFNVVLCAAVPRLHVSLLMFAGNRIPELQSANAGASHDQKGDIMKVALQLRVGVLHGQSANITQGRIT